MSLYLITGGAGFIGSHTAVHLARAGHDVRIFDNFSGGVTREQLSAFLGPCEQRIQIVEGDVRDLADCRRACVDAAYVLHHAAVTSAKASIESPGETMLVNTAGAANMLQAAAESGRVKRFVNASSCAIYGDGPSASTMESSTPIPRTPYATSMLAAEHLCVNFYKNHDLATTSLRYFNVYGPDEPLSRPSASVVAKFAHAVKHNKQVMIFGDGEQTRDFIHIDDAIEACLAACLASERNVCGQSFNVGTGTRLTVRNVLETVQKLGGVELAVEAAPVERHEIRYSRADVIKAAGALQFTPAVSFEDGMAQMVGFKEMTRAA